MTFGGREFRDALALFASGVAVVTTMAPDGTRFGKTISSFNAVSLDPPLILFSIARTVQTLNIWQSASSYTINLLNEKQEATSTRFAGPNADKCHAIDASTEKTDLLRIAEALACFECEPYAQYDGGDHVIFVGRVHALHVTTESAPRPLVFFRSRYRQLDATTIRTPIETDMWLHGW